MAKKPEYLDGNVRGWQQAAPDYVAPAEKAWSSQSPYWGIWSIPEQAVRILPEDMIGMRCIELGCGTAYVSAWMARRGAEVTAIDPTPNQLATARRLQREHGIQFQIHEGYAEELPFDTASFDFAISEYGAALWADPYAWIPEAARILRPGAQLVLLSNSPLAVMCCPDLETDGAMTDRLLRPYFTLHRTVWLEQPEQTEFHLTHGEWIRLFTESGFEVERLLELPAPPDASTIYSWADPQWAAQWPTEDVWVVRRRL